MPIPLPIDNAGFDVEKTIDKLIAVEKLSQKRIIRRKKIVKFETDALQQLQKKAVTLQDKLQVLKSFRAAFDKKGITSTPEGFIAGTAHKLAEEGNYKLTVKQLAQKLRISSKRIKKDLKAKKGRITINGETKKFGGGSLYALSNFLNANFPEQINAKSIPVTSEENLLVIESKTTGKKGAVKIEDPDNVLADLGVVKSGALQPDSAKDTKDDKNKKEDEEKDSKEDKSADAKKNPTITDLYLFDKDAISVLKEGNYEIAADQRMVKLKNETVIRLDIAQGYWQKKKPEGFALAFDFKKNKFKPDKNPTSLETGPKAKLNIKGIVLDTYNISRDREVELKAKNSQLSIEAIYLDADGKKQKKSFLLKAEEIEKKVILAGKVQAIIFHVKNGSARFKDLKFSYKKVAEKKDDKADDKKKEPKEKEEKKLTESQKNLAAQKKRYPNLVHAAQNAIVNFDGVDIERASNTKINDIIKGVDLDLQRADAEKEIEVIVKRDGSQAKEQILDFVKAYNELLQFYTAATHRGKSKQVGDFKEMKDETGILANNTFARSMVDGIKLKVSNPYPANRAPHIRVFSIIGISTGEVGSDWSKIQIGELQVNEKVLDTMLQEHPRAVKEFFVIDSNADRRPDNGFAFVSYRFLKNYTGSTGIITRQIKGNGKRIKDLDKQIAKIDEKAEAKRLKLRRKFGYMQSNVGKQKAIGDMLKNRLGNRR